MTLSMSHDEGLTPLMAAAFEGNIARMEHLLSASPPPMVDEEEAKGQVCVCIFMCAEREREEEEEK